MTSLSIPAAIVVGFGLLGVFTGLGLYFGLRGRAEVAASTMAPAESASACDTSPVTPVPLVSTENAVMSIPGAPEAAPSARRAIESQHPKFLENCWKPSLVRRPQPASAKLSITLDYAPDGLLTVHRLEQDMTNARPELMMCVNKELVLPVIEPPGRRMRVVVPINFP